MNQSDQRGCAPSDNVARCVRDWVKTCKIVVRADVGGVLVAPRLLTCKELRGERATYSVQANVTAVF